MDKFDTQILSTVPIIALVIYGVPQMVLVPNLDEIYKKIGYSLQFPLPFRDFAISFTLSIVQSTKNYCKAFAV